MSFQRYPLPTVQKVSQFIRNTLVLPAVEQHPGLVQPDGAEEDEKEPDSLDELGGLFRVGDMPEDHLPAPNTEGRWFVSMVDPSEALAKFPGLWVRPGIRLVTYLRQDTAGGVGTTIALPDLLSTTEYLDAAIEKAGAEQPPQPMGALPNLMAGIDGDGSLSSFLEASIFIRELRELGRLGRYARWVYHRYVAAPPQQVSWEWRCAMPEDFSPKVVLRQDGEILVEFYSCRVQKPVALFRHLDRYPPNSYTATNQDQVIAVAGGAAKK